MIDYDDPRKEIRELIRTDLEELLLEAGKLHGHYCPYLALGIKAGAKGMKELNLENEGMEEILAIVETNNCFSDGIQYSTGCTFGNNSLIFKDYGKTAVTFARRGKEEALRITVKPGAKEEWESKYPEYEELFEKVVKEREGNEEDRNKMMKVSRKISFEVIGINPDSLFEIKSVSPELPGYAPIHESIYCSKCGESVMSTRIVEKNGEKLCIPCAGEEYYYLDGTGLNYKK